MALEPVHLIEFLRNRTGEDLPHTWRPLLNMEGKRISASIVCARGHHGVLTDHIIDKDGIVSPSVVCPEEGCDFHEFIRLIGWSDQI